MIKKKLYRYRIIKVVILCLLRVRKHFQLRVLLESAVEKQTARIR